MASERIPQGGALTVFRPELAAQGFYRDPAATGKYYAGAAQQSFQNLQSNLGQKVAQAQQNALFPRSALLGGALLAAPSLMSAAESASEGRTLEATVQAAGGIGAAALGTRIAQMPGLAPKVVGSAIALGGGLLSGGLGQMAERTKAAATGQEIAGQEGSGPATRGKREKQFAQDLDFYNRSMSAQNQNLLQLMGAMNDQEITMMQRQMPLINQMKNQELARNQALMNTMTNNYSRLGMLATAGKLATGAQAERGATMRTALQSNPYSGAVMQAPNISF
tara:strand:- start:3728 stop:4564 length:837 start_codon:yes stop_codon:yes gene_type:complete